MSVYGSEARSESLRLELEAFSRRLDDCIRHIGASVKGDPLRSRSTPDELQRMFDAVDSKAHREGTRTA